MPVDVSESALTEARPRRCSPSGPDLRGPRADRRLHRAGSRCPDTPGPRLVAFLGGTIGNLLPAERAVFLTSVRSLLSPGDALLLGTDLVKDESVLVAAYDDAAGVTAAFNKNVLSVVDRELGADFDPDDFDHVALWDAEQEWIEMRLRARRALTVKIPALDLVVAFEAGEELRTEVSAKFRQEGVRGELAAAGLRVDALVDGCRGPLRAVAGDGGLSGTGERTAAGHRARGDRRQDVDLCGQPGRRDHAPQ